MLNYEEYNNFIFPVWFTIASTACIEKSMLYHLLCNIISAVLDIFVSGHILMLHRPISIILH